MNPLAWFKRRRFRRDARIKFEIERSQWIVNAADLIQSQMRTIDAQEAELVRLRDPNRVLALVSEVLTKQCRAKAQELELTKPLGRYVN
jgi:hypothetical protein